MPMRADDRSIIALPIFVMASLCLAWPQGLYAHNNNYPFDYDPARSEDPQGIAQDLQDLHDSLPGLPENGLVEIEMDGIAFNYYAETLDMIRRARDSGPGIMPPIQRVAQRCSMHASFSAPSILVEPASSACQTAAGEILAAFDGSFKTCQEVEYPEVYVFDHPPGVVDANFLGRSVLLSTLEGQIALIGEALSHIEYPVGLIPDEFWPMMRSVIAKVRYQKLGDNIDARLDLYNQAQQLLQSSASCFDTSAAASLQSSIDDLSSELSDIGEHLDQLYADGLAQAAQDRLAVENQGRLRNDLTEPALTDREREMLAFYLTAIYWRMRGESLVRNPANGEIPDITYVVNTFERIAQFAGGLEEAENIGNRFAIDESYGYAEWWDLGNSPGHDQFYDLLWMTDRGRRGVNLVRILLSDLGYDVKDLLAGGLIMGPCYYYMWYELWERNGRYFQVGEDLTTPYFQFVESPYAGGEVCYGGSMGLGFARTLLWGRPDPDCQPNCSGRDCGSDGCGGSCGSCTGAGVCSSAGQCVEPGFDAGVVLDAYVIAPDATSVGIDAAVGVDAAASTDAVLLDNASTTGDAHTPDGGANADTAAAGADATSVDAPGAETDSGIGDVDEPGCAGCATVRGNRSMYGMLLLVAAVMLYRRCCRKAVFWEQAKSCSGSLSDLIRTHKNS